MLSAADCPICTEPICKAACGRCMHKFCYECLLTWCSNHNACPTCRTDLEFIALDPAFDALVEEFGPSREAPSPKGEQPHDGTQSPAHSGIVVIDYRHGSTTGVRIGVKAGPGVRVTGVQRSGLFHAAGLRPGDVIYELNGFPCNDIRCAIDVINSAQLGCKKLRMRVTCHKRGHRPRPRARHALLQKRALDALWVRPAQRLSSWLAMRRRPAPLRAEMDNWEWWGDAQDADVTEPPTPDDSPRRSTSSGSHHGSEAAEHAAEAAPHRALGSRASVATPEPERDWHWLDA